MMKNKAIALFFALTVLFTSVPMFAVVRADGGNWSFGDEDLFSGNSQVFMGADGSKTEIFDNGSMCTTYPDGSKEGLDKDGNHFKEAKDGTVKFETADGAYGTKHPDGSGEGYFPDGSNEIYHADGTYSKYDAETGLTKTFDKNDNWTGVYLDENNKIDFYDENGGFKTGTQTVTDKTGKTITYTNEKGIDEDGDEYQKEFSINITDKNGDKLAGVNLTDDGKGNETLDIKDADGMTITGVYTDSGYDIHAVSDGVEYTETETTDESGNKTVTSLLIGDKEGHVQQTVVYDKDDNFVKMTGEVQWTEDGKTTTITNDDTHIYAAVENEDGSKSEHTVTYGEGGKESVKSVHTYKDGSQLSSEVTGSGGVVTGRTDTYTDKNGNEQSVIGKKFENADGSKIEFAEGGIRQTDADGGITDFTDAGVSYSNEDGSLSWNTTYDGELLKYYSQADGVDTYIDPETGERVFENEKVGCVIRYKEDENGTPSGSIKTKDGFSVIIKDGQATEYTDPNGGQAVFNPDGSAKMTLPDGRIFEADGKGNVFENGKQIQKDGVWTEGYGPSDDTGKPEDVKPSDGSSDADFTGGYYGTYDYTAYWDNGKQKHGERGYYAFKYNGCYYLVQAKEPNDVKARIQEAGVEGFFNAYYDDRLTVENASFDPATRTATYLEKSYMNDVQYISTVYTIVFDGKGGVTVSWESQNVARSFTEPQEKGVFTGSKK